MNTALIIVLTIISIGFGAEAQRTWKDTWNNDGPNSNTVKFIFNLIVIWILMICVHYSGGL